MGNTICPKLYSANNETCEMTSANISGNTDNSLKLNNSPLPQLNTKQSIIRKQFAPTIDNLDKVYYNHEVYNEFFHVVDFSNKTIIFFNNNCRRFPVLGWFQKCFSCETPTGQLEHIHDNIYVRVCSKCKHEKWTTDVTNELEDILEDIFGD